MTGLSFDPSQNDRLDINPGCFMKNAIQMSIRRDDIVWAEWK